MRRVRRAYYDWFSRFYDRFVALHSRDKQGLARKFLVDRLADTERRLWFSTSVPVPLRFCRSCKPRSAVTGKLSAWIFPTAC